MPLSLAHGRKPPRGFYGNPAHRAHWVWQHLGEPSNLQLSHENNAFVATFDDMVEGHQSGPLEDPRAKFTPGPNGLSRGVMDRGGGGVDAQFVNTPDGTGLRLTNPNGNGNAGSLCEFRVNYDGSLTDGPRLNHKDSRAYTFALVLQNFRVGADNGVFLRTESSSSGPLGAGTNNQGVSLIYNESTKRFSFELVNVSGAWTDLYTVDQDEHDRFAAELVPLVFTWKRETGSSFYFGGRKVGSGVATLGQNTFSTHHIYVGRRDGNKARFTFDGLYTLMLMTTECWTDQQAFRWMADPYAFLWPQTRRAHFEIPLFIACTDAMLPGDEAAGDVEVC